MDRNEGQMGLGAMLFVFGVLVVIIPACCGPRDLRDYARWLTNQPLIRIFQLRYCVISGMLLAAAGALLVAIGE